VTHDIYNNQRHYKTRTPSFVTDYHSSVVQPLVQSLYRLCYLGLLYSNNMHYGLQKSVTN